MLTAQKFYSHPDSPRDQLFRTPTQGRAGLGPPIPLPELNSQGASGPLPELRQETKAAQPRVRGPKEENRPEMGQQRERADRAQNRTSGGGWKVCFR